MTYFFETYGCEMNIAESAAVEQLLIARNWTKASSAQTADLVILNTCSVRETAENRIIGRLGWYNGLKAVRLCKNGAKAKALEEAAEYVKNGPKPFTLVVMGCMAERLLKTFQKDYPFIDYVVGTYAKHHFGEIILAIEEGRKPFQLDDTANYKFASVSAEKGSFSTFVPIMHGCNNFCTYCIVPYVRGRECSRPVDEILKELDVLNTYGVKEITLIGQNVNSYHGIFKDKPEEDVNFAALLKIVAKHLKETSSSIKWVRFMSSHPKDLSDEVINTIAGEPCLCHHIHLPVQHGSTPILKRMNRVYTAEQYIALVEKIRRAIPDVSLTTDLMMGFPGETEEDVEATLQLMKTVRYEDAFMYYYNPREGTPACKMPQQLSVEEKKARLQRIIDLQLQISSEEMEKRVGTTVEVLVENVSRDNPEELLGKTQQNKFVAFKAQKNLIGTFVTVHLDSLSGSTYRGTLIQK